MFINTASGRGIGPNRSRFFLILFDYTPAGFHAGTSGAGFIEVRAQVTFLFPFQGLHDYFAIMAGHIRTIIRKYTPRDKSSLISILQAVQKQEGYLSPEAVELISRHLGISKSQVFGVATFYRSFSFTPKGECCLSVCVGTACHVRGAQIIAEELERVLGIKAGETTPDRKFSVETVSCLGACALGPIVVEDGQYHGQMNINKTQALLEKLQEGKKSEDA
jgi:NADH-quinone oxidoreductase subunit E